jgi:UDP-N-acetylglucosamine 4,6-dehydratase/5-epimerase
MSHLDDKVILITGGTGSFGQQFTDTTLKDHNPHAVRIFSRDELKQHEMAQRLRHDSRVRFFIGDVRDKERLYRAMKGVHIVVHAAALKQVPAAEYNPLEAVKTNIMGGANVIDAAIDNGVEKVIFLSTDKAVRPVNLYGATKLVAEKLCVQANAYAGGQKTRFSCVRYGNVVGSRGSVIPLFLEGRRNGVIRITDERMSRFWITLEQGVRFVVDCIARMAGGEIFVPKIPSMRLVDTARTLAPNARWEIIGMRPGEKVHEELITADETPRVKEFATGYIIEPQHSFWDPMRNGDATPVPSDFEYRSDTNTAWMSPAELKACIADSGGHLDDVSVLTGDGDAEP